MKTKLPSLESRATKLPQMPYELFSILKEQNFMYTLVYRMELDRWLSSQGHVTTLAGNPTLIASTHL